MDDETIHGIPEVGPEAPETAVRVYGQDDSLEDFPVLKAFQQYIDAEQARARKRMLMLCAFFGVMMVVVIAVFVGLLMNVSSRNQSLNDRLVEYAMKDRERQAAVVVQASQDSAALQAMTEKIDALQKKLAEDQARAAKAAAEAAEQARLAAIEAAKPKGPTPEELEIKRLKALLAAEKEKQDMEKEKKRQEELEVYRRKHYPELYADMAEEQRLPTRRKTNPRTDEDIDRELDRILNETKPIEYFNEEDDLPPPPPVKKTIKKKAAKKYSIPVDIKGSSGASWQIPED